VAQLLIKYNPLPQEYIAVDDSFGESGTPKQLMEKYGLDTAHILKAVEKAIKRKKAE
jgi:transketolase